MFFFLLERFIYHVATSPYSNLVQTPVVLQLRLILQNFQCDLNGFQLFKSLLFTRKTSNFMLKIFRSI